ncbi:right-handed parallel beta-helix repeat-containing protein [Pontibacter arcticus]|uniref:Right handed beta helix domain-containing protein n=1 Tax=Pontibacter arcticus TaxID=2080288 RepID=A0A364RJ92_9BACT|nr:hypothetical protein [Pontibacter arcticus]RAU84308.1 hypothetical protein DP923_04505 [Pontibacter arcticus]
MKYLLAIIPLLLLLSVFSCEPKDEHITSDGNARLTFSGDTILFDTVFVTQGSITKRLKVYNPNAKAVEIEEIGLAGAETSAYELIINGVQSLFVRKLELRGKDSLLILVKVNINPKATALPFLVADSILFRVNGNRQNVKLVAYGQDAYFYQKASIGNTVWDNSKPHVLLDTIQVQEGATLTIEKGTRIYARNKAALLINGKLVTEGTPTERIVFSGYRREPEYVIAAGQWAGIRILAKSSGNTLKYTDLKNATTGLYIANPGMGETLVDGCTVQYALQDGIAAYNAEVKVVNSLLYNCGQYSFGCFGGGTYQVLYSTIVSYGNRSFRDTPLFAVQDNVPGAASKPQPVSLRLVNSIIYSDRGTGRDELQLEGITNQEIKYNLLLTEKYKTELAGNGNKLNENPKFKSIAKAIFELDTLSPASGAAIFLPETLTDMKGKTRGSTKPDLGAYERSID